MQNYIKQSHGSLKCEICNVELPNETSMKQHTLGQRHMKLFNAKEEQRRVEQKCGIYVRGYPPDLGEDVVLSYFSTFGEIVWKHFGHNFLLLDFSEPQAVEKIMSDKIRFLGGRKLTIRYRELKPQIQKQNTDLGDTTGILEELKSSELLSHQVCVLANCLQGTTPNSKWQNICWDLEMALKYPFPRCSIRPFGSTLTGLNFHSSDIDVYIGGIRGEKEEDIGYLYKLKKILSSTHLFSNAIVIGQAKIPILKCIHIASNTNCDINIRNMLGVCNTRLISYYINIDNKIKEMMLIIKYWAKVHRITGQNNLFTNYSLCLMIIFYLQGNPYHLPSVKYLQDDPNFANIQEHWDGGFKNMRAYCPHIRSSSLLDMLCNFFSYYADFDYGTYVICPYLGVPIEKKAFSTPETLSAHFHRYKEYALIEGNRPLKIESSVCVQDPFEHSRNVTPIVSDSTLNIFSKFCRHAKKICDDGETGVLYRLFMEDPPNVDVQLLSNNIFTQFGITMGTNLAYLRKKVGEDVTDKSGAIKELWFESVKSFAHIVLKDFLNFQVEENSGRSNNKHQKFDGQKDVYTRPGMLIASYKCAGKLNLWNSRRAVSKCSGSELKTVVERETEVTKQLVKIYKDINNIANIIEFEVTLEKKFEPSRVVFSLTKTTSYKKTFKSFGEFFANKFGNWFELYEKDLNSSCH